MDLRIVLIFLAAICITEGAPDGMKNVAQGANCEASSAGATCSRALDGSASEWVSSGGGNTAWVKVIFNKPQRILAFSVTNRLIDGPDRVIAAKVEFSDGSSTKIGFDWANFKSGITMPLARIVNWVTVSVVQTADGDLSSNTGFQEIEVYACGLDRFGDCSKECHCTNPEQGCDAVTGTTTACTCLRGYYKDQSLGLCRQKEAVAITSFSSPLGFNEGHPGNITCTATGGPLPDISLLVAPSIPTITTLNVDKYNGMTTATFAVSEVERGSVFECHAENSNSGLSKRIAPQVYLPPVMTKPPQLVAKGNAIDVKWLPWDTSLGGNGPVIEYRIYWTSVSNNDMTWEGPGKVGEGVTEYTITDLEGDLDYEVSVSAVRPGVGGEGPKSALGTTTTDYGSGSSRRTSVAMKNVVLPIAICVIVGLLIAIAITGFCVWKRYKYGRKDANDQVEEKEVGNNNPLTKTIAQYENEAVSTDTTKPLLLSKLGQIIAENKKKNCKIFSEEYSELPTGLQYSRSVGELPDNLPKNRYRNIIPYDSSRVILEGDNDYINASYVSLTRDKEKLSFIAAQGPKPTTVGDFWLMVWQQKVSMVVMLTNVKENQQSKCAQYWPEEGSSVIGDITVEISNTKTYGDYICRTFMLRCKDDIRSVKQYHYITWPDKGVPSCGSAIIAFIKFVKHNIKAEKITTPVVVHCSAGVGRTGTFMALYSLLDDVNTKSTVDVYGITHQLRQQRVNMVQHVDQYIFMHDTLLEYYKCGETLFTCPRLPAIMQQLTRRRTGDQTTALQDQFDLLKTIAPDFTSKRCSAALSPENVNLNRDPNVVPSDDTRVFLAHLQNHGTYINAAYVPGYRRKRGYIATQMPLQNTVVDFWRLVFDLDVNAILMLNELTPDMQDAIYWPQEGLHNVTFGMFEVTMQSRDIKNYKTVRKMIVRRNDTNEERKVQQLQVHGWSQNEALPTNHQVILNILAAGKSLRRKTGNGTILVHCQDGASRCGLYCVLDSTTDRMNTEIEVDVFDSVTRARKVQPKLIPSQDHYAYCYDVVHEYYKSFQSYSNFR